jgi:glycosyltransferase involved in cell wall biosynthesis
LRDVEILIVVSGSEDETLAVARRYPARILEIPRETFSYGRAQALCCGYSGRSRLRATRRLLTRLAQE